MKIDQEVLDGLADGTIRVQGKYEWVQLLAQELQLMRRLEDMVGQAKRVADGSPGWAGHEFLYNTDEGTMLMEALSALDKLEEE